MPTEIANDLWTAAIVITGALALGLWAEDRASTPRRRTTPAPTLTPLSGLWVRRARVYDRRTTPAPRS